jgi:hypothetical protein
LGAKSSALQSLIIVPRYRIHGLTVGLPISVDGFLPAPADTAPDIDVVWTDAPEPDIANGASWREIPLNQNRQQFPIYRAWQHVDRQYVWHSVGPARIVKYHMPAGLRWIEIRRTPTLSPLMLVRPAFGQALAFLLRARGRLLIHAAGVEVAGRAILIVGAGGQGKSTLIFELIRQGCRFLSDDMALPDLSGPDPTVHAGHGVVKLMPDSLANFADAGAAHWPIAAGGIKREFPVTTDDVACACPIGAIILLEPRGTARSVALEPVPVGEALVALNAHIHPGYLPVGRLDHDELPSLFKQLSQLVGRVRVMRLGRPDRLEAVPEASRRLIAAITA